MVKKYLAKLYLFLRSFSAKPKRQIPILISSDEQVLRALFKPTFVKVKPIALQYHAFLPSARSTDEDQRRRVSVFRKEYSSDSECKNFALKIPFRTYVGFVAFYSSHIENVNARFSAEGISAKLVFTPLDDHHNYIDVQSNRVFIGDPGSPFHAEIIYNQPLELDNPNIQHRVFAEELVSLLYKSVHIDPDPKKPNWSGAPITVLE